MGKTVFQLLRNGWLKVRLLFYRRSGRRILANAAFYLTLRSADKGDAVAVALILDRLL